MTYLLVAYFIIAGAWHADVLDTGLTAEDCAYALIHQNDDPARPLGCEPDLEVAVK